MFSALFCFLKLSISHGFRIEIVVCQPLPGNLFPFGSRLSVVAVGVDGNATPGQKFAPDFDISRIHQTNQVIHDNVDAVFVKIAVVPEAEQV